MFLSDFMSALLHIKAIFAYLERSQPVSRVGCPEGVQRELGLTQPQLDLPEGSQATKVNKATGYEIIDR